MPYLRIKVSEAFFNVLTTRAQQEKRTPTGVVDAILSEVLGVDMTTPVQTATTPGQTAAGKVHSLLNKPSVPPVTPTTQPAESAAKEARIKAIMSGQWTDEQEYAWMLQWAPQQAVPPKKPSLLTQKGNGTS